MLWEKAQREKPNQKTAQEQEDLRRDLNRLEEKWYKRSGKLGDVANLKQAGDEMKDAEEIFEEMSPAMLNHMGNSQKRLLGMPYQSWSPKWLHLLELWWINSEMQLQELAENQREIQGETQGASPGKGDPLKKRQDELNSAAEELLKKIDEIARSLGKFNENAMEDLLKGARESRENGLERSGKRASNSLLYENFPSAEREEGKVAENLESLENDMKDIANKLRTLEMKL